MKLFNTISLMLVGLLLVVAGCNEPENSDDAEYNNSNNANITNTRNQANIQNDNMDRDSTMNHTIAIAVINPTKGNQVKGEITFRQGSGGVKVHADVTELPQGRHGFHVHLYGDCSAADGTSAGTHFNFEGSSKNPPADIDRITGNLGEITAQTSGSATADTTLGNTSIDDIMGRAVIIHAKGNDPSQPPIGAAGARLGCGVIGHANPESMSMMKNEKAN